MSDEKKPDGRSTNKLAPGMLQKQFKPGQSGNPGGRPPMTPAERKLKKLTREEVKEMGDMVVKGNIEDLDKILDDPDESMLKKLIAKSIQVSYEKGDWSTVDLILNRLIGKVKDDVSITLPVPTIIYRPNGDVVEYGAKLLNGEESDDE